MNTYVFAAGVWLIVIALAVFVGKVCDLGDTDE